MTKGDGDDDLERWLQNMNKGHGYGGVFNYQNSEDKRIVELSTAQEWQRSLNAEFGIGETELRANPNDPPDFLVSIGKKEISLELVQLIEQEHKERALHRETPYGGDLFMEMQWSEERFLTKVHSVICTKGDKYRKKGITVDILLIHTAEPWLTSEQTREWLSGASIEVHPNIHEAHLLFEYEPGRGVDHWPLLRVYGDLTK